MVRHNCSETAVSDDVQLIDRALRGQSEAFGLLVLKYQDRLFNAVFHVVGHAEDARDIVQEALVQAFLKLNSFRRESAFYTWLYRIAFNLAASHQRRRRPTASLDGLRESGNVEPADEENDPAESLERQDRCRQVRRAIAQLADEYRSVLVLREIDGCRYEMIAEVLDLPINTVRSRLHRARLQLKEELLKEVLVNEEDYERYFGKRTAQHYLDGELTAAEPWKWSGCWPPIRPRGNCSTSCAPLRRGCSLAAAEARRRPQPAGVARGWAAEACRRRAGGGGAFRRAAGAVGLPASGQSADAGLAGSDRGRRVPD